MSAAIARLKADHWHVACGVCRRRAIGIGYVPAPMSPRRQAIMWLCGRAECSSIASTVYRMPPAQLDVFEIRARNEAGDQAGAYLDEIGKTDLGTLTQEEWFRFLTLVIEGFEHSLRRQLTENAAPF